MKNEKNQQKKFVKKHDVWQRLFFLKTLYLFSFPTKFKNGFHRSEGLIFLDSMHHKKNEVQNRWDISKKIAQVTRS